MYPCTIRHAGFLTKLDGPYLLQPRRGGVNVFQRFAWPQKCFHFASVYFKLEELKNAAAFLDNFRHLLIILCAVDDEIANVFAILLWRTQDVLLNSTWTNLFWAVSQYFWNWVCVYFKALVYYFADFIDKGNIKVLKFPTAILKLYGYTDN